MTNYTKKNDKLQDKKKYDTEFLEKPSLKKAKIEVFYEFVKKYKSEVMNMRISECASLIGFLKSEKNDIRLGGGNFCNSRFCPFCDWRKAKKDGYLLLFLMNYVKNIEKKELIFLTLTAPNVPGEELENEIKEFNKSFERMAKTKGFRAISKGYIRKLEITYNSERNDYHPHFHVVLAVNSSYFKKKDYISQKKWLEMWQLAKRDSSITQVDIRKAKMDDMAGVYELATYSAKSTDYLHSETVFDVFYNALKSKKLIVFNGIFKDVLKSYKNGELEEFKEFDEIKYLMFDWYKYQKVKGYELFKSNQIPQEKRAKIYIDEIEID